MMTLLLDGRLVPITTEVGFLEADRDRTVRAYLDWMMPIQKERGVHLRERRVGGGLETVLLSLLPLTSVEARRYLFVPTDSPWTAYFDNGHDGTDAFGPMSYLAERLGCRGLRVVATPGIATGGPMDGDTEGLMLDLYGPERSEFLNYVRSLSLANEGGRWQFEQSGTPLPFEDTARYRARRTTHRFTIDMLADYTAQLGVRPFDERYYLPPNAPEAVLIEKIGPTAPDLCEFDLEEARTA